MLIDSHIHVWSFPAFRDLSPYIRTMEDAIAFRTRHPDIYKKALTEQASDNTDDLIADMDKNGVDFALVQARPGTVTNDMVAQAAARHPRLAALARLGHDQQVGKYLEDPTPAREKAPEELEHALTTLGMRGIGELFVRALTNEIHHERIAKDLDGVMRVAAKHNVPVQLPTAYSQFPGGLFYGDPLWVDEVAGRHPEVPIILTKMGRGITTYFDSTMTVAMRNANIYLDVVGTTGPHLRIAIDKLGADRIMFGTDWSATWRWLSVPGTLHQIRMKALDNAELTAAEREQIQWKTTAKLFRLAPLLQQAGLMPGEAAE